MSKKETPPYAHSSVDSIEFVDSSVRQLCSNVRLSQDSILNTPRRPQEIIWSSYRDQLEAKSPILATEGDNIICCFPLKKLTPVDILSQAQYQQILSYVKQNGSINCPVCIKPLEIKKNPNTFKFSDGSKIIFAVSTKLLFERDNLSFETAKDIYDIKRVILDNKLIRIDVAIESADWLVVSTLSLHEFEQYESEVENDLKKFGEWSIFELNNDKLKHITSKISCNYCKKCQSFFDEPQYSYTADGQIKAKIANDELFVDDFNFIIKILNSNLQIPAPCMLPELYSFINNYNNFVDSNDCIDSNCEAVINQTWIQLKDLFFAKMGHIKAPEIKYQNRQNIKITIDQKQVSKLNEITRSAKLWEFFGIEKALVTLVKSTSIFKSLEKKAGKVENFAQILSVIPNTQDVEIFNVSLKDILNDQIDNIRKIFVEDRIINNAFDCLVGIGLGVLKLSDTVSQLMSTEVQRLAYLQTIFSERRRKTQRVYLIEKDSLSDLSLTPFGLFNLAVCHQLTANQKAFIVSSMRGKTDSKNKASNTEVCYEFSI